MAYSKTTWVDEILAGVTRYDILEDDDTPIEETVQVVLSTAVTQAGTSVEADVMNNIEDGIEEIDTKLTTLSTSSTETLSATKTLVDTDEAIQYLDPGGSDRDVNLPAEGSDNHYFVISNQADTDETLTVKNDGTDTIAEVGEGETKVFYSNGVDWVVVNGDQDPVYTTLSVTLGDGSNVITTGVKGFCEVAFDCIITAVRIVGDASGSIVVDIWKDVYANFPPTVADTITASAKPTLSTAQKAEDTTLTGWTKTIAAGSWLAFNVDSATTVKQVTLSLTLERV